MPAQMHPAHAPGFVEMRMGPFEPFTESDQAQCGHPEDAPSAAQLTRAGTSLRKRRGPGWSPISASWSQWW